MGRLIDADDLIELLHRKRKTLLGIGGNTYSIKAFDYIIARIAEQPIAYDIEGVVAELKRGMNDAITLWDDNDYYTGRADAFESAIDIVRKGGAE